MTREEFLRRLNELLSDVTDEERAEAIRFYEEYLDDAGPEQEAQVLAELGSPEKVAAIIRANVHGSRVQQETAAQEAQAAGPAGSGAPPASSAAAGASIPLPPYARPGAVPPAPPCKGMSDRTILLIILAVVLFPLWIGLAGTVFGILMGLVGAAFGFFFGGVGTVIGIVTVLVANTPAAFGAGIPVGLFMVGLCLLGLALGIALIAAAVWRVAWLLPACWRLILRAWRALTGKKEAK
ncbi:DUF1700 domain-containing protein [Candidatus Allofournierella excrementavium]|uniref:DUF1700 domain-containing protein n=1 Tax=Candidatus Allofournierella excrementavium TaxID=2838591 RepID=UPI003A854EA7